MIIIILIMDRQTTKEFIDKQWENRNPWNWNPEILFLNIEQKLNKDYRPEVVMNKT